MNALTDDAAAASPNDLVIGIIAKDDAAVDAALDTIDGLFKKKKPTKAAAGETVYTTIQQAAQDVEGLNMAVVSVPGRYAARECALALNNGINVFLFSDNVTVEEEIFLKDMANEKGLLMMGPDCGTAIINGVPLGFANVVRKGDIGIAAASGTGLQHITTLIDFMGAGVSQAIGVGGRDLSSAVGGRTLLSALDALAADPETKIVMILSKPPAPEVAEKVIARAKEIDKPVVMCLFGREIKADLGKIILCPDMEQAAKKASELSLGREVSLDDSYFTEDRINEFRAARKPEQKYVRGIFGGGTVCDEAMVTFRGMGIPIHSNIPMGDGEELEDVHKSVGNTFIDMGDDYFTRGKPHPMIDPSLRNKRIVEDALMPDTAVMLLDVELGYGSHPDPAGVLCKAVEEAKEKLGDRKVLWLASVVASEGDPQGFNQQIKKLLDAGFAVTICNIKAARVAAQIAAEGGADK
jgi:succinyl-CoA synthetase alpha subunit